MRHVVGVLGGVAALVLSLALAMSAVSQTGTRTLNVNQEVTFQDFTIVISGTLMVDEATGSLSGTLSAVVMDAEGNLITSATGSLTQMTAESVTVTISLPAIGLDLLIEVDVMSGYTTVAKAQIGKSRY